MPRPPKTSLFQRINALLHWTPHSLYIVSAFLLMCGLIAYIWRPLAVEYMAYVDWDGEWWRYIDWLLIGIFLVMSFLIMAKADLRSDAKIVLVGLVGGLVIESWGTQTNLWFYFTVERPPLWIIPAWPIASLSINRMTRAMAAVTHRLSPGKNQQESSFWRPIYWFVFLSFYAILLVFVAPTFNKSFTIMALVLCAYLILTPTDHRWAVLTFLAGCGLGYFLERWGTTRECWTYYTYQTPPFFAVLAHGLAAVAFWRAQLLLEKTLGRLKEAFSKISSQLSAREEGCADCADGSASPHKDLRGF